MRTKWTWLALVAVLALLVAACGDDAEETTTTAEVTTTAGQTTTTAAETTTTTTAAETTTSAPAEPLVIGMILVGPQNDHGWSQANYEAGLYLEEMLGAEMIVLDKVNTADRPETTVDQVVTEMIDQGADLIFATSDDMKDGIELGAAEHPEVPMVWASGDSAWTEAGDAYRPDLTNLANIMGRMEYGKMMAGCAAALTTETGQLGYLGPLINAETRRLASSVYLGARYCWENYPGRGSRRPELPGQLDRLLVQHPRRHPRPHPGGQRLLRLGHRRGDLRHRHHRGAWWWPASGPPPVRPSGPSPTTSKAPATRPPRSAWACRTSTGARRT